MIWYIGWTWDEVDWLSLVEDLRLVVGDMVAGTLGIHAHHFCTSPARSWVSRSWLNNGGRQR